MNKEENPCWHCPMRTENCHSTCKKGKIAKIKMELEKRKIKKFKEEHSYSSTAAQVEILNKNQKKYNEHGLRRK